MLLQRFVVRSCACPAGNTLHCLCRNTGVEQHQDAHSPGEGFQRFKIVFEPDAYYMDIDLIIALTRMPQMALLLAAGFVWGSKRKDIGALAAGGEKDDFQLILQPNIEF